jgi:pectin methylesterase-like acyl-CoA thioesterase
MVELFPKNLEKDVNVDTYLKITFDSEAIIGDIGIIAIYDAEDDSLVHKIDLADHPVVDPTAFQKLTLETANTKINIIGNVPGEDGITYPNQVRIVNYNPVIVDGRAMKIIPHNNKLKYNKTYYIKIDNGAITGTSNGIVFTGIEDKTQWCFSTKAQPSVTVNEIYVDSNGTKDFTTVQGALDYIPASNINNYTIHIATGVYEELLFTSNKSNIFLIGEDKVNIIIQYNNYDSFNNGTGSGTTSDINTGLAATTPFARGGRSIFLISGGDNIQLDNIIFKSTHPQGSAQANQAETIYFNSTGRLIAKNCSFTGYQDTLQLKGFSWFYNCFISGDVDFIWGANNTALFEKCEIQSRYNSNGGYIVQARSISGFAGFVFLDCLITRESDQVKDNSVYLARSYTTSRANTSYNDNVAFINCKIDTHIKSIGYLLPSVLVVTNPVESSSVSGWREYGSYNDKGLLDLTLRGATNGTIEKKGPVYSSNPTVHGTYILTQDEANALYSNRSIILSGTTYNSSSYSGYSGGWNPSL